MTAGEDDIQIGMLNMNYAFRRKRGMKYTDVAWDFDGTLIDTYPNLVRIFKEMLNEYGYTVSKEEIHMKMSVSIGYACEYFSEKYGIDLSELKQRYRELRELNGLCLNEMRVYPGKMGAC